MAAAPALQDEVAWQELELGGYTADLPVWGRLAEEAAGPGRKRSDVLELGAGTGRVTLALAERGHRLTALDIDPRMIDKLRGRAGERDLSVRCVVADLRSFELDGRFDLVIAPAQVVQLLPGAAERHEMLRCVAGHLHAGGRMAAAVLAGDCDLPAHGCVRPLPDMSERDGWSYSSHAVAIESLDGGAAIALRRLRHVVSPSGEVARSSSCVRLATISPGQLEREARQAGLVPLARREVPASAQHAGSAVVVFTRTP